MGMEPEKEVSFLKLIRELNRGKVRHLVIGRRAVILYGGPVLTGDTSKTLPNSRKPSTPL